MFLIDQGEKKLIKRTLLDEEDNPIPWDRIVDVRFNLSIGGNPLKTYSKEGGQVKQAGPDVSFQITQEDTNTLPPITYDLKVSIDVYDDRFDGLMTDTQWQYGFSSIRLNINRTQTYDSSVDTGSMKFAVIPEIPPQESEPQVAPAIGEPETTYNSMSVSYSPVNRANSYEYQLESDSIEVDNGSSLSIELENLTHSTTDRIRVRGRNNLGVGPWSDYKSFTTNPNVTPIVSIETTLNSATYTIANTGTYEVEMNVGGSWTNFGNVTEISSFNLQEGTSYTRSFRFRNAGGVGPINAYSFTTKELPQSQPIILDTLEGPGIVTVDITLVTGITGVEYRLDAGTPVDVGLTNEFNVTTGTPEQTHNLQVRYYNDFGGGPWSEVRPITPLENTSPTISDSTLTVTTTDSSYTVSWIKATDNKPDTDLRYFLVEGNLTQLQDETIIQELTDIASALDVNTFTVNRGPGFNSDINVYVKDNAGNISLYTPNTVFISDPEILNFSLNQPQAQGDVGETTQLTWEILATDGADDTVTFESSDVTKVTVSPSGLVTFVDGGLVNDEYPKIRAYPSFYGDYETSPTDQRAEINVIVNVYENETSSQSPQWNYETVA